MAKAPFTIVGRSAKCECGAVLPLNDPNDFEVLEEHLKSREHIEQSKIRAAVAMGQEYEERAKAAKVKTLQQILEDVDVIHEVYVPEIDGKIRYKKLTVEDVLALPEEPNVFVYNRNMLAAMIRKADPTVTDEQIQSLPFDVSEAIMHWVVEKTPFLHLKYVSPADLQKLVTQYTQSSQRAGTPSVKSPKSQPTA